MSPTSLGASGPDSDRPSNPPDAAPRLGLGPWYVLFVLATIYALNYMDRLALSILLESIKRDLKLSDTQLGLLTGLAFAIFYSIVGLPLARYADRASRTKLLTICTILWSIMTSLTGLASSFVTLALARVGVGVGEAGCVPSAYSLIGDIFPRHRRLLAITLFHSGATVGSSAGLMLVGLLGDRFGWRISLVCIGLAGLPIALLFIATVREPVRTAGQQGRPTEPALVAVTALLRRPAFRHVLLGYSLASACTLGLTPWVPTFLMRSFDMGMAEVGLWSGLASGLGGIPGLIMGGVIASWLGRRDLRWELWLPALFFGAATPLYVCMFLSPTAWLAIVLKLAASMLAAAGSGLALGASQSFAEPHRRATAVSLLLFLSTLLGAGTGPFLIGMISDLLKASLGQESLRYALLFSCVLLAWSAIHFFIAARYTMQDRVD